jgi:hypothetical protein
VVPSTTPLLPASVSTSAQNASVLVFSNTVSGTPTIVKVDWSGSEAGIIDVSGSGTESFLLDPGANSDVPFVGSTNTASVSSADEIAHTVDLAMADNAITYSKTPSSTASAALANVIVPFVFVKTTTTITDQGSFTNLTADGFKILASGGDKLGLFTGNTTNDTKYVYLAGRDDNSGTRVNVLDETGYGAGKSVNQIVLAGATQAMVIQSGSVYYTDEGQASGGTLAKSLYDTTSATDQINGGTGFIAVAYLGMADDATAEGSSYGQATRLTYNGVAYSVAAVENGTYTIWGNEYILNKSGAASYVTALKSALDNSTSGIANSAYNDGYEIPKPAMHVSRSGPLTSPVF